MAGFALLQRVSLNSKGVFSRFFPVFLNYFHVLIVETMFKHNISIVLNSQRPDKKGQYPVRIRTTIKRKVTYYSTGIMLAKDQLVKGEVVKHPHKSLINGVLRKKIGEIEKLLLEADILGVNVTKFKSNHNLTFNEYANKNINLHVGLWSVSTVRHKRSYLNKISEFKPNLKLSDINPTLLTEFENYCRSKGNIPNTVWSATKFFKTIINAAVNDGTLQKNPIKGFKGTRYTDPMRSVLTQAEITKMEEFADNKLNNPKLVNVASWFILGAYTGLRYADMKEFKGLVDGKVLLQTQKTDSVVSIFATKQIIKAVSRLTTPIYTNQKCNEYIIAVCAILGIEKKISFHNSRHSFACMFLENGGDVFLLSKILGHSSVKTTMIYSKVTNPLLDREMKKVFK